MFYLYIEKNTKKRQGLHVYKILKIGKNSAVYFAHIVFSLWSTKTFKMLATCDVYLNKS